MQMCGIDTPWIVARMKDVESFGDRTVVELVGDAMGTLHLSVKSE